MECKKIYCLQCGKEIIGKNKYQRKFCSRSCSATYNNTLRDKMTDEQKNRISESLIKSYNNSTYNIWHDKLERLTNEDVKIILSNCHTNREFYDAIGLQNRKVHSRELSRIKVYLQSRKIECKIDRLRNYSINKGHHIIEDMSKGEVFRNYKSYQSARSFIRKNAIKVYNTEIGIDKCAICGYNKHIDVAHIKAVSDFEDDVLIKDINNKENLIGLCPNHHWEYDNGLISYEEIMKYKRLGISSGVRTQDS